jgi:hypothetical protein
VRSCPPRPQGNLGDGFVAALIPLGARGLTSLLKRPGRRVVRCGPLF